MSKRHDTRPDPFTFDVNDSGRATWYGYEGRGGGDGFDPGVWASTNDWLPCSIGFGTAGPGATMQNIHRNSLGFPVSRVDFGSDQNCLIVIRTNQYIYAANNIDLLQHIGPDGVVQEAYGYDGAHSVIAFTNALGEVTRYTYNANEEVASITQPNGLLTTNSYNANGFLAQQIVVGFSTNSYTYTNGLVYTHTDERGLTVTNTWDALQRLVNVAYPDGTSLSYVYSNLDVVRGVDRLGLPTGYAYDSMERKTGVTNALGYVTHYTYCTCGSLESIVDAGGNTTSFFYDQAGRLTNTIYADGLTVSKAYDQAGDVINVADSSGNTVSYYRDGFQRLVAVTNAIGQLSARSYDDYDQVATNTDANGVVTRLTYDALHRLQTRTYPDSGVERYGYTLKVAGPTSYTNQITNVVLYAYDVLNRKTNEVYLGVSTNRFAYDGAGDLLVLTDGNGDKTSWNYDFYGRVTNKLDNLNDLLFVYKYDPDNRLTNRWSAAKTNTFYKYDAVGNLTNVVYPVSPSIVLAYDPLNRLTTMVDGVGTTLYGYDGVGQVLSEDGPWPNDTVNYTYANRLRASLSVQAPNGAPWSQSYGYDTARRLTGVSSPAGTFGYSRNDGPYNSSGYYSQSSSEVISLALPGGAYITNTFDSVARETGTWLLNSAGSNLDSYVYTYNQGNQRTEVVRTAGDYVTYTYDNMGELLSSYGAEPAGGPARQGDYRAYAYDGAGNLLQRKTSRSTVTQTLYGLNSLNEITNTMLGAVSGTWSATVPVSGSTTVPATNLTVNGVAVTPYQDNSFAVQESVASGLNTFTALAQDVHGRSSTSAVTVTVIPTNNAYSYDLNGNLLGDGTRNFAYDDENQLIAVWQANAWSNSFAYDGKLRRRIERDSYWNAGTSGWILTNEIHFVYDGNLVVQERNAANLPQVTYTRGNDLSGSLQGAGGIGGLLARTDNTKLMAGDPLASAYYHCDGNGNVTCLVSPYQEIAAKYLYDPFGNTLAMYGTLATANTYRFSSKEWNGNSGLYYYLYRFYDPNLQRWLNRDPLADEMSLKVRYFGPNPNSLYLNYLGNPYEFDFNNPEMYGDPDGEFAIVLTPIAIGTIVAVGVTAACLASPPCRHALFNLLNQVGKTAHCSAALTACLNDPWIKCPTSKSGYQKKDCRSCYNECLNDGAWPYYKCP